MERGASVACSRRRRHGARTERLQAQGRRRGPRQRQGALRPRNARPATCSSAPGPPASPVPTLTPRSGSPPRRAGGEHLPRRGGAADPAPEHQPAGRSEGPPHAAAADAREARRGRRRPRRRGLRRPGRAKEGDDPGRLAAVGASQAEGTAEAENGTLEIPVAAAGLAYQFADAKAPAGELRVASENPQSVPHDIAVEGNGVNEKGEVVQGRRHVGVLRQPAGGRVHVLLLRARPPRGWHGRHAHRRVAPRVSTGGPSSCGTPPPEAVSG